MGGECCTQRKPPKDQSLRNTLPQQFDIEPISQNIEILEQQYDLEAQQPEKEDPLKNVSFSNNFDSTTDHQSKIEEMLKHKKKPGKLNPEFLNILESQITGGPITYTQKDDNYTIVSMKEQQDYIEDPLLERPFPQKRRFKSYNPGLAF